MSAVSISRFGIELGQNWEKNMWSFLGLCSFGSMMLAWTFGTFFEGGVLKAMVPIHERNQAFVVDGCPRSSDRGPSSRHGRFYAHLMPSICPWIIMLGDYNQSKLWFDSKFCVVIRDWSLVKCQFGLWPRKWEVGGLVFNEFPELQWSSIWSFEEDWFSHFTVLEFCFYSKNFSYGF